MVFVSYYGMALFLYASYQLIHGIPDQNVEGFDTGIVNVDDREKLLKKQRLEIGQKYLKSLDSYDEEESYVDPYSMFDLDETNIKKDDKKYTESSIGLEKTPDIVSENNPTCKREEKSSVDEHQVYIKRWLKKFLRKMNYSPDMDANDLQTAQFSVSNLKLHKLATMLNSEKIIEISFVDAFIDNIAAQFYVLDPESLSLEDVIHFVKSNYVLFFTAIASVVSLWYLRLLLQGRLSLRFVLIIICLLSVLWTWIHLYEKELAKKYLTLDSLGYPEECQQHNLGFFSSISLYLKKSFFTLENKCAEYYEAQIVDPFWKVSPLMVISETITNFVLQPVGAIAKHANIFLRTLYSDINAPLALLITLFLFLFLLMKFKYKLRLPLCLATLEPGDVVNNTNRVENIPINSSEGLFRAVMHECTACSASPAQPITSQVEPICGDCINISPSNMLQVKTEPEMQTEAHMDTDFLSETKGKLKDSGDTLQDSPQ